MEIYSPLSRGDSGGRSVVSAPSSFAVVFAHLHGRGSHGGSHSAAVNCDVSSTVAGSRPRPFIQTAGCWRAEGSTTQFAVALAPRRPMSWARTSTVAGAERCWEGVVPPSRFRRCACPLATCSTQSKREAASTDAGAEAYSCVTLYSFSITPLLLSPRDCGLHQNVPVYLPNNLLSSVYVLKCPRQRWNRTISGLL